MYRNKSLPLSCLMRSLLPAVQLKLVELHSQVGSDSEQLNPWLKVQGITDWKESLSDFSDTAYIVSNLILLFVLIQQ